MRKGLNNKRNEIAPEQIDDLTRVYGNFQHDETRSFHSESNGEPVVVSKVFDNADFGFRQITIERPLRLNFRVTPERIERLRDNTAFSNLAKSKKKDKKQAAAEETTGRKQQDAILGVLATLDASTLYKERERFLADLSAAFNDADIRLPAPIKKAILTSLSERDETAAICRGPDGSAESDSDLRDFENVPLTQSIYEYFEREVKPYVPDAWINETVRDHKDGEVGKVYFEVPLTRHFYRYKPPRPLEKIEDEIANLERDIVRMLREVVG
jgi:type I restriction enzyme M protein